MLYGANTKTVSSISGIKESKMSLIKEELDENDFFIDLRDEFDENKMIFNYYGRPVLSDNNLFNYWIQSSAVDFCSFAFFEFRKKYNLNACYFIHDSMTISVSKEKFDEIKDIKELAYEGITIPIEINILS